jgi:tripartite-type tricarboxylate transporter receptor subunit TctC
MAMAHFEAATGIKLTRVQYKGGAPASQSILVGDTQVMFAAPPTVMGLIKAGRLRALVVSMKRGSPSVPGVPGTEEAGLPSFEFTFWFGLFAPAGTPAPVMKRLHQSVAATLAKPEVRARIETTGMDPTPSTSPEAFAQEVAKEAPQLERLIRDLGMRVD